MPPSFQPNVISNVKRDTAKFSCGILEEVREKAVILIRGAKHGFCRKTHVKSIGHESTYRNFGVAKLRLMHKTVIIYSGNRCFQSCISAN